MYVSARHLDIKRGQDIAYCNVDKKYLLICDGIGGYDASREVAEEVVNTFEVQGNPKTSQEIDTFAKAVVETIKSKNLIGGTTFIHAQANVAAETITINYLGNGGIIHLNGNFNENPSSEIAYRYIQLMQPHVNPQGELTRHISHNSSANELRFSRLTLNVNHHQGDILLFYTDGINSVEENVIVQDNQGRLWRHESNAIYEILKALHSFLMTFSSDDFESELRLFNLEILNTLKEKKLLEDDASLGIIMTEEAKDFYHKNRDVQ